MLTRIIKDFWLGLRCYYRAFHLIFQDWLWLYYLVPVVLTLIIYLGGEYILHEVQGIDFNSEIQKIKFPEKLTSGFSWDSFPADSPEMNVLISNIKVIFVIVSLKFRKYLVLMVLSPVLSSVSFQTERILTGNIYPFELKQFIDDIYRGVNFSIRNMFRQMLTVIAWYLVVMVIRPLDVITPYLIFVISSYYYGSSIMDFTNERRRLNLEQSVEYNWKNVGFTTGIGIVFYSLFFVSFIGIIVGPITAAVAATIGINEKVNLKKNKFAKKQTVKPPNPKNEVITDDAWL